MCLSIYTVRLKSESFLLPNSCRVTAHSLCLIMISIWLRTRIIAKGLGTEQNWYASLIYFWYSIYVVVLVICWIRVTKKLVLALWWRLLTRIRLKFTFRNHATSTHTLESRQIGKTKTLHIHTHKQTSTRDSTVARPRYSTITNTNTHTRKRLPIAQKAFVSLHPLLIYYWFEFVHAISINFSANQSLQPKL